MMRNILRLSMLEATSNTKWFDLDCSRYGKVRVRFKADRKYQVGDLVILFEFSENISRDKLENTDVSLSERLGPFAYAAAADDSYEVHQSIEVADCQLRRIGLRLWNANEVINLTDVEFDGSTLLYDSPIFLNVSVDVEALPGRATSDHVNVLINGFSEGRSYGIF
jgi:hypothetical protein